MDVSYFSRRPVEGLAWRHVPQIDALARSVDYLVCALPGGDATRHLVDARVLDALGPSGYLVNVGRGSVVDEAALIEALEAGRVRGAALDVFEHEPEVPEALLRSDRTIVQGHCGGKTVEAYDAIVQETLRRLQQHFG